MATSTDKFKITIRIADLPDLAIPIERDEEEAYRSIAKEINSRWEKMKRNPKLNDDKLRMAIIALQFAKQFYDTKLSMNRMQKEEGERQNELNKMLTLFENDIDNILLKLED